MAAISGSGDWRYGVLAALGAPDTAVNLDALDWWAQSEGTPSWWNNWLATTEPGYGGRDVNSYGVKAYPTLDDGIAATAATLRGSAYFRVVQALRSGNSLTAIFDAVNASPWCYGCQAGHYPVALYNHLGRPAPAPSAAGTPHFAPPPAGHGQAAAVSGYDRMKRALSGDTSYYIGVFHHLQVYYRRSIR